MDSKSEHGRSGDLVGRDRKAANQDRINHELVGESGRLPVYGPIAKPVEEFNRTLETNDGGLVGQIRRLKRQVERCYPGAWEPLQAALAVVAAGSLADNDKCIALILMGLSGVGKTLPLSCIMPDETDDKETYEQFYRSDKFTAASFVSHRADRSKKQLGEIDLLPRIKDKTLVTPELAPLFRGKRDELTERFAVLTRVLDGDGYQTDSGAQGRRGYADGKYVFRWLGATTPLENAAVEVMGHLGPRLLFYEVTRDESDDKKFAEAIFGVGGEQASRTTKAATRAYALAFRRRFEKRVQSREIEFPQDLQKPLLDCARLLVRLRAPIMMEEGEKKPQTELPERAAHALRCLAIGRALTWDRKRVSGNDIRFVRHIALSSGVPGRQQVMRALIGAGGNVTVEDLIIATRRSRPFVEKYAKELVTVGLVRIHKGGGRGNETLVCIEDRYRSLLLHRRQPREKLREWQPLCKPETKKR